MGDKDEFSVTLKADAHSNTTDPKAMSIGKTGTATIPMKVLLKLLKKSKVSKNIPYDYLFKRASYLIDSNPNTHSGHARMHCRFEIQVLTAGWCSIGLLSNKVALTRSSVNKTEKVSKKEEKETKAEEKESRMEEEEEEEELQEEETARVAVLNSGIGFLVNTEGTYTVEVDVLVPYSTARQSGIIFDVPKAASNELMLTLAQKNVEVKIDPSLSTVKTLTSENTIVKSILPTTSQINIQWTEKVVEERQEVKEKLPLTVTAIQTSLYSIGEGMVNSTLSINYKMLNGSVSVFDVSIDDRLRVLNVDGTAIKRWEIVETPPSYSSVSFSRDEKKGKDRDMLTANNSRILRVYLEYGFENNYTLTISSEMEMKSTSCDVSLPIFKCVGAGGTQVSRDQGSIGVEARTNVEIQRLQSSGLQFIDTSELAGSLWELAANPILLAYKFLDPNIHLLLQVKKHADVDVLTAVVEAAHIIITQTEEGHVLTKIIANVRNTQKQFLQIAIPNDNDVWSAVVAGRPVKPARDKDGVIMIPLQKTNRNDNGGKHKVFNVEFVYFYQPEEIDPRPNEGKDARERKEERMKNHGRLTYHLPVLDLPINRLFVSVYLPLDFKYGEFSGDMKELYERRFSMSPPTPAQDASNVVPVPAPKHFRQASRSYLQADESEEQVYEKAYVKKAMVSSYQSKALGVLPVRVEVPIQGREFRFEQLLSVPVRNEKMVLWVEYQRVNRKGCCRRRRVSACSIL